MRRVRAQLAAVAVVSLALPATPALAQQPGAGCTDGSVQLTVEERRLDGPVPQEILRRSGFGSVAPDFTRALCRTHSYREARTVVTRQGQRLWQRAVDRVQGRGPAGGDLDRADDRPLYWARLGMTGALRQWRPGFGLSEAQRSALRDQLERTSRGHDTVDFPGGTQRPGGSAKSGGTEESGGTAKDVRRVLVTGFDPFTLDEDIRISNPSGAGALALDGTVLRTEKGPVRIETALFPVRWGDFAHGTVEKALRPHLPEVDMFATVSQGRPGRFDVERYNGAWRGTFPDNENVSAPGTVPVPGDAAQPQWTATTLPYKAVTSALTGRFPVQDHTEVVEIPAGASEPVTRPDGPTEGSTAREGGGGDYLSNEIAYRATLLRDRLGLTIPGGHVHTPVLEFGEDNADPDTGTVTDPQFLDNRRDIVRQLRSILRVAAGQ
ncbi:pyroglutamyl peptidase [Streptomyces nanshensis]|uniref:pyroglutamyl peptidase n=1 Tax=Streptomyces nanshensis TaxID=518642 RepID=UPI00085C2EE3|nr:pyroglutamyl peptidase [Streptomyces nanshensis]